MSDLTSEEILKAARDSATKDGEAEIFVLRKAVVFGAVVSVAVCLVAFIIKAVMHKIDFIEFSFLLLFFGTSNIYFGNKGHSKKNLIEGIIELVFGSLFFIAFLGVIFLL